MRTISEAVEDIKSILNNVERTEECTGETLVDINELVDEILTLNHLQERKCEDCANIRDKAIDEFVERMKEEFYFTLLESQEIDRIVKEMKGSEDNE